MLGGEAQMKKSPTRDSLWFRFTRLIAGHPVRSLAFVLLAFLPLFVLVPQFHCTADLYAVLPGDMDSVGSMRALQEDFPPGRFDPFFIILSPKARLKSMPRPLMSKGGYAIMLDLCDSLSTLGGISSMLGPTWMMKERVDWKRAVELQSLPGSAKLRILYTDVANTHVNGNVVMLQVHVDFLSRGPGAATWVENARIMLRNWEEDHPEYEAHISGGAAVQADIKAVVMQSMPFYIGVSLVVIMPLVYCMYGSVVLPLRLAFALLFTLATTYGVAVAIYQTPLLHGIFPSLAKYDGVCFEAVPIATVVAMALGLDYDIFLISRIIEYRLNGLSHMNAVIKGVAKTGGIISGAGVIMALSFSGMFFFIETATPAVCLYPRCISSA